MSAERPFVHLHCHSHYSLLDGASRIPELVQRVKDQGMNAVALTDHGNLYGAIELYREATAAGIKPIIGYEAYIAPGARGDRDAKGMSEASFHLTLLARNRTGFQNLIKMASIAFLEGFYYRPRIDKELLAAHSEGLICLSGCPSSEFSTFIQKEQASQAKKLAEWFQKTLGEENFFIEIQNNGLDFQKLISDSALDIAKQLGIPPVVTSDAHYLCQADSSAHDVLLCINTGKQLSDPNRLKYGSDQFYVRSPEQMYELFPNLTDAVRRTQEIADRCDIALDFKARHFPVFTPPKGKTAEQYLKELCEKGLKERFGDAIPDGAKERLTLELGVINKLGFAGYFLIVWDFVRFAREKGIPAGARGSACGALVSYLLYLSHVDPLKYDLLFERFLDPNREEAPDIDIDFCQDRREEVLQYVRDKYGEASVAQIATFGTMAARAAIKDVGRVLGVELARVDQLTKMVPKVLNITLENALEQSSDLRREYDNDPKVHELIDIAKKLEGTNRNVGTHAAGVVIANGPITDFVPVQRMIPKGDIGDAGRSRDEFAEEGGTRPRSAAGKEAVITTQWTMEDLDKVGMLKMDFLGLRNLTILDKAVKLIEQTRGVKLNLHELPLDDKAAFALFQRGDTQGVFQFESGGIRDLLQRMKPDSIKDIIAANALYRPGPLGGGMVDAYVNRKHGKEKPQYVHAVMQEILAETYGVMVYQEQVMRILNRLGGIELSSAYACIKAISKKKHDVISKRQEEFIAGAVQRGLEEYVAREIFEQIVHFGGYGFNKSHSAAYALVAFQTAYLKAHFTPEFMAALLSSEIGDTDSISEHIENARQLKLELLTPDVNVSDADFTVRDGKVVFGLAALRGVGRKAAENIRTERQANGPFKDVFNFCERVDQRIVTKAALETLVKSGAFDQLGGNRAALLHVLPAALQAGSEVQDDRKHGQKNFFESLDDEPSKAGTMSRSLPTMPDWSESERLKHEKEALGFYVSSHPLTRHEDSLRQFSSCNVIDVRKLPENTEVIIGGMLVGVRFQEAKRSRSGNTKMARCKLEDLSGNVECVIFPDDYVKNKEHIKEENICFVRASVDRTREEPGLIINRILTVEQAQRELTRGLKLSLQSGVHEGNVVDAIANILKRTQGECPVYLEVSDSVGKRALLRLGHEYSVNVSRLQRADLEMVLGQGRISFLANGNGNANGRNGG